MRGCAASLSKIVSCLSGSPSERRVSRPRRLPRDRSRSHGSERRDGHPVTRLDLADSALHAPASGFGDTEFYPEFIDKAAVLIVRLAKNHPLPDGNKRAAWVALRLFVDINAGTWAKTPSVDEAERAVLAIAAGEWSEQLTADWLREHLAAPTS